MKRLFKLNKYSYILLFVFVLPLLIFGLYYASKMIQEPITVNAKFLKNAPGQFLEPKDGYTHYQVFGPDTGKPILLIHGGGATGSYVWIKNYPALLRAGYRVYMYDLYGRGYSERPNQPHTLELFSLQLHSFLDSMALTEPVTMVALSLGAMPAIDYASKNPTKVRQLILVDPAALNSPFNNPVLQTPIINQLMMTWYWHPQSVEKQMNEFFSPDKMLAYRSKLKYFAKVKGYEDSNLSTWLNILSSNVRKELIIVGQNKTPSILIFGEKDPYFPKAMAVEYEKLLPDIQVFPIPNAGHVSNYEQPTLVNEILIKVIANDVQN